MSTEVEYECPDCNRESTFSKGGFGLSCGKCGYTPRKHVRDKIRSLQEGEGQ